MAVATVVDDRGAEIRKETGTGTILEIDRRDRNIGFKIKSDNRAVQDPITGWLDTFGLGEGAHPQFAKGQHVRYEIHVRRKDGVAPTIPIAKLKPREKVRDLVLIQPLDAGADTLDGTGEPAELQHHDANPELAAHFVELAAFAVAKAALITDGRVQDRLTKAADVLAAIARELHEEPR